MNPHTPATVLGNSTLAAGRVLTKLGAGTLVLGNVEYMQSGVAATTKSTTPAVAGQYVWQLGRGAANTPAAPYFDGAVRETGSDAGNSLGGINLKLAGGVLETTGTFSRALGTGTAQVQWTTGGGGFAAYGAPLTVNIGGAGAAVEWQSASFVGDNAPLVLGSLAANDTVTWQNAIGLANGSNHTKEREIRVYDNTNAAGDRAVLNGSLRNRGDGTGGGTGTRSLLKTGAGTLVLAGASNDYNGYTYVKEGTLLVNGTLSANGLAVSNAVATTLGGTGTIDRPVVVHGALAPGDGSGAIGKLSIGNLTLAPTATLVLDAATLPSSPYTIVAVGGTGAVSFNGIPEGGFVWNRDHTQRFTVTYLGGDGNDVALRGYASPGTVVLLR